MRSKVKMLQTISNVLYSLDNCLSWCCPYQNWSD